jgi:tetratricopeptide (TPR) repeat protein
MDNKTGDRFNELVQRGEELFFDGEYAAAEEPLRAAIEIGKTQRRVDMGQAAALNMLSAVLRATNREEEALQPCLVAFTIMENQCEPGDSDLAGVAGNIGQIYRNLGRGADSLQWLQKAVDAHLAADPQDRDPVALAKALLGLAESYDLVGDNENKIDCLGQALLHARVGHYRDLDVQITIPLSEALLDAGQTEAAVQELEASLDEYLQALKAEQNPAAYTEPESATFEMLKDEYKSEGREPVTLLLLRVQLARLLRKLGRTETLIENLPEMGTFEGRIYGENSMELGLQYQQIGAALHLLGQDGGQPEDFVRAEKYYRNSLHLIKQHVPANHPLYQEALENLTELYEDTGRDPSTI